MKPKDLVFKSLASGTLKPYAKRAPTESVQFLRWLLENVFRQDPQTADDACVDKKHDKGVDAILINDVTEEVYVFQSKLKQKANAKLGDTDLKEFFGTVEQFKKPEAIQSILDGGANSHLKQAIQREGIKAKVEAGYEVVGFFCTNVALNKDGLEYLEKVDGIEVYDADRICAEFVDLDDSGGISASFKFDVSDTEVVHYETAEGTTARIFLASALQLTHMSGIADGSLFSQNVRLSLGHTKVNKALTASVRDKNEHKNFPLYHNGITIICQAIDEKKEGELVIKNYVVVNGAQSLSSLLSARSSISADLKILVKVVALGDNTELSEKITQNSNNQNATKPRDMRSNDDVQQRLKKEVKKLGFKNSVLEVKRGEAHSPKDNVISNEDAGLAILAIELAEPWSCHQKYKVMDQLHARIFARKEVNGAKLVGLNELINAVEERLDDFEDKTFGHYTLTKYFLAHVVAEIFVSDVQGKAVFGRFAELIEEKKLKAFVDIFSQLASTAIDDLEAEVDELEEVGDFDYKRDLKSPNWCRSMAKRIKAAYNKDVKRKRVKPIADLLKEQGIVE